MALAKLKGTSGSFGFALLVLFPMAAAVSAQAQNTSAPAPLHAPSQDGGEQSKLPRTFSGGADLPNGGRVTPAGEDDRNFRRSCTEPYDLTGRSYRHCKSRWLYASRPGSFRCEDSEAGPAYPDDDSMAWACVVLEWSHAVCLRRKRCRKIREKQDRPGGSGL
jgi:hypothetical protein